MPVFLLLWWGQTVSMLGSQFVNFALGVWMYQRTGSVTLYGLIALASVGPQVLATPFAGVLADRIDRRWVLLAGHAGAGICSALLIALHELDMLTIWTVLPPVALSSIFHAPLLPTFAAATTVLVPREQLGRANGLVQLGAAVSQIATPAVAGYLLLAMGLRTILLLDVVSFLLAIVSLLLIRIPRPAMSAEGRETRGPVWRQVVFGWQYIRQRPGLVGLLAFLGVVNFSIGMVQLLVTPMVLGFTDATELGVVLTAGGVGMLAGSGVMVAWGGPRQRIFGVLGFVFLQGLLMFVGAARPSALLVGVAAFGLLFAVPLISGCSQTVWQRKVPADVQGRVLAVKTAVAGVAMPLAFLLAGPLADGVFEPLMAQNGALASTVGSLLGVGRGRGVALLFIVLGCLMIAAAIIGYNYPRLRRVEAELPDTDEARPVPSS
jgi:DHA3 family macrolide efflux protein-like MFS transporter